MSDNPYQQAAFGAGLNLAGGLISSTFGARQQWKYQQRQNAWNAEQVAKQNAWNAQQAQVAYQRQIQFYNMQNDYNSPINQIARLRAAGVNPNLAYSNGVIQNVGSSAPGVSPAMSTEPAQSNSLSPTPNFSSIGSDFINMLQQGEQNKLLKAQADKVQKEGVYQGIENAIKMGSWVDELHSLQHKFRSNSNLEELADEALRQARLSNKMLANDVKFSLSTFNDRVSQQTLKTESMKISNSLNRSAAAIQSARVPYAHKMAALEFQSKTQELLNAYLTGRYTIAQTNLAFSQIVTNAALAGMYNSQSELNRATAKIQPKLGDMYASQKGLNDSQSGYYTAKASNEGTDAARNALQFGFDYPDTFFGHLVDGDGHINTLMVDGYIKSLLSGAGTAALGYFLGVKGGKPHKVKGF